MRNRPDCDNLRPGRLLTCPRWKIRDDHLRRLPDGSPSQYRAGEITRADVRSTARGEIATWAAKDARTRAIATRIGVDLLAGEHWPSALAALGVLRPEATVVLYASLLR